MKNRSLVAALLLLASIAASLAAPAKSVMPWMCLERCGDNQTAIDLQVSQILSNPDVFDKISFELYNLGPNGTLVLNPLSPVGPRFVASGSVETHPMISSFPYPPDFLLWMRQLWEQPELGTSFIKEAIAQCVANKWSGLNVDWEPTDSKNITSDDAINYANFLAQFSTSMHDAGFQLTVDVALWSPIWNLTAIGMTSIDRVISMGTYTSNLTTFASQLQRSAAALGPRAVGAGVYGVGLASIHLDTNKPWTQPELQARFDQIAAAGVTAVQVWKMPIDDMLMPFLRKFKQSGAAHGGAQ